MEAWSIAREADDVLERCGAAISSPVCGCHNEGDSVGSKFNCFGSSLESSWRDMIKHESQAMREYNQQHRVIRQLVRDHADLSSKLKPLAEISHHIDHERNINSCLATCVPEGSGPPIVVTSEGAYDKHLSSLPPRSLTSAGARTDCNRVNAVALTPMHIPARPGHHHLPRKRHASADDVPCAKLGGSCVDCDFATALDFLEPSFLASSTSASDCSLDDGIPRLKVPLSMVTSAASLPEIVTATLSKKAEEGMHPRRSLLVSSKCSENTKLPGGSRLGSLGDSIKQVVGRATGVDKAKKKFVSKLRRTKTVLVKSTENLSLPSTVAKATSHHSHSPVEVPSDGWLGAVERYTSYFETGAVETAPTKLVCHDDSSNSSDSSDAL